MFDTRAGTPQGGVISPTIANRVLDGLEAAVDVSAGSSKPTYQKAKPHVIRYADDFVVTSASKEVQERKVLPAIRKFLAVRGLELSGEKTRITNIADGFDFWARMCESTTASFSLRRPNAASRRCWIRSGKSSKATLPSRRKD
ncbi:reverse transcriptase/maturase family protein [Rhizobium mesoamericanum]|uniref:reverse transcriptase/maturase family protein n=1 Tax=Rhizobium TaxID=379 RepID=UPI00399D58D8